MNVRSTSRVTLAIASIAVGIALTSVAASTHERTVAVATHATLGAHLVDGDGRTLYAFINDVDGESTCYDACAEAWPPFVAAGEVSAGDGVDAALIGTLERRDGAAQVTYAGWPLYTFAADSNPGDSGGHGRNDVWFVVDPNGVAVGAPSADADDLFEALMSEGDRVYARICASCHGAQGDEALSSHVVIIANNGRLSNERLVVRRVIHGNGYMPGFGGALSDREVAAVATYVRNSFGNEFGLVGEEAAAQNR